MSTTLVLLIVGCWLMLPGVVLVIGGLARAWSRRRRRRLERELPLAPVYSLDSYRDLRHEQRRRRHA